MEWPKKQIGPRRRGVIAVAMASASGSARSKGISVQRFSRPGYWTAQTSHQSGSKSVHRRAHDAAPPACGNVGTVTFAVDVLRHSMIRGVSLEIFTHHFSLFGSGSPIHGGSFTALAGRSS